MSHGEFNNRAISFDCDLDLDISDFSSNISPYYENSNNIVRNKTNGKIVSIENKKPRRVSLDLMKRN